MRHLLVMGNDEVGGGPGGGEMQHEQAYGERLQLEGSDESGSKARLTVE